MKKLLSGSKPLAISWFVFISVLFFLPGSAIPKADWTDRIHLDKWVHCGFFAVLVFLWSSAFSLDGFKKAWPLITVSITYGFLVEVVQKEWIANRSFDLFDVVADAAGSVAGWLVWLRYIKK